MPRSYFIAVWPGVSAAAVKVEADAETAGQPRRPMHVPRGRRRGSQAR